MAIGSEAPVQTSIAESWRRCASFGLTPGSPLPPVDLLDADLQEYRAEHVLAPSLPIVRRLLADHAVDDGLIVAVGDAAGRLLWLEGHTGVLRRAERIHFVPGSRWDEADAGTNAPALALALDRAARVHSREHLIEPVRRWSCSAAPVHDPASGRLLGFLDVTGAPAAASASMLALVRLTVEAVEADLAQNPRRSPAAAGLQVLGRRSGSLSRGGQDRPLSPRHAEILVLLEANPGGLTAEQLATMLDARLLDPVTVRAEMTRLRHTVGADLIGSRPYRLLEPLVSDLTRVRRLIAQDRLEQAVGAYTGPLLPGSEAPGIVSLRHTVVAEMRAAVLLEGRPGPLLAWGRCPDGADDRQVWSTICRLLPEGSAQLPFAMAHLQSLAE